MLYLPASLKRCCRCQEWKPYTAKFFGKNRHTTSGLNGYCKHCDSIDRGHKPYQRLEIPKGMKQCTQCNTLKPLSEFNREKLGRHGRRSCCKICQKANLYTWRSNQPQKYKQIWKRYQKKHRAEMRLKGKRRHVPRKFVESDWYRALEYFDGYCAVCGKPPGLWQVLAMDHWIPVKSPNCPGSMPTNIVPLCHSRKGGVGSCNNLKGNRMPEEWLIERYGKRKARQILARIEAYFDWVRLQDSHD